MRRYPRRWIVYDTETTEHRVSGQPGTRELTFRLGAAVGYHLFSDSTSEGEWLDMITPEVFHDWIDCADRTDVPIWIFAHNHSFDARVVGFFRDLALGRYALAPTPGAKRRGAYREPLFLVDGPPFLLRLWREDGQQLILADTYNWLEVPLAQIGDWLGYPKGRVDFAKATDAELLEYCRRDVEITDRALQAIWGFCRKIHVVHWQPTIAAQALSVFRGYKASKRVKMPDDVSLLALDRHAYYGGRQEAFRLGRVDTPVHQVDVNSMYPYVMKHSLFPCEVIDHELQETDPKEGPPPHPSQTTAEVWLDAPDTPYPVHCRDGVWHCRGRVRTILCGPELRRACEARHVIRYSRYCRYRLSDLFSEMVQSLWDLRLDAQRRGEGIPDRLSKSLMNSLTGKFGQKTGKWVTQGQDYPRNHYGHGLGVGAIQGQDYEWRIIAGTLQHRTKDVLAAHAFVPISAYITSYGRVFMDAVRSKLWEPDTYYQATDSLLLSSENLMMLAHAGLLKDDELGMFRHEGTWEWIDIKALNWIERNQRPIRGGVPHSAEPLGSGVFMGEKWGTFWGGISTASSLSPCIRTTLTRLSETYSRGRVSPGGACTPWRISNWHLSPEEQAMLPILPDRDQG